MMILMSGFSSQTMKVRKQSKDALEYLKQCRLKDGLSLLLPSRRVCFQFSLQLWCLHACSANTICLKDTVSAQGLAFKRAGSLCPLFLELALRTHLPCSEKPPSWKWGHVCEPQSAAPAELPAQSQHQQPALEMSYLDFKALVHSD